MITREADYAVRMILCLAEAHGQAQSVSVSEIAARMDIPYRFLRALSRKLVKAELVRSRRGSAGGFELTRAPAELSLLDVIRAVDPKCLTLNDCLLGRGACSRRTHCTVHPQFARVQKNMERTLDKARFDRLAKMGSDPR